MAVHWKCDICGQQTNVHPPTELLFDEEEVEVQKPVAKEVEVDAPDPKDPTKTIKVKRTVYDVENCTQKVRKPRMATMKRQNPQTGDMEDIPIQASKDLEPRAYLVRLGVGSDNVTRDFCKQCLDKHVLPVAKPLWDKLASIGSK